VSTDVSMEMNWRISDTLTHGVARLTGDAEGSCGALLELATGDVLGWSGRRPHA